MFYYRVIVPVPKLGALTYRSEYIIPIGSVVEVEVGKRFVRGIVFSEEKDGTDADIKIKDISLLLSSQPVFPETYLKFIVLLSEYYCNDIGTVMHKLVPIKLFENEKELIISNKGKGIKYDLNDEQYKAYKNIKEKIDRFNVNLLYGVTGSGKTEVYCEVINEVIKNGGQILYIVPEIALTSQLFSRLKNRIDGVVEVYHSKVPDKKRKTVFKGFNNNKINIILGARSALFLPPSNLKLIIVDEEHEFSYKQEDAPYYQLRDMAVLYGKIANIPVILGSATPSLESFYNVSAKKYNLLRLNNKFHNDNKIRIELVDMKEVEQIGNVLSIELYNAIYDRLTKNEQVLLLVNKKGYSNFLVCRSCGEVLQCVNCSVSMTYYKNYEYCKCHYCDGVIKRFVCKKCGCGDFVPVGVGSEKVYEILNSLFPDQIIRIDQDVVTSVKRLDGIFKHFAEKSKRILVGTNIITKGLDYPDITLIGVINIDNLLMLPDFRAEEKAFHTLVQFVGRGGRFYKSCDMIIQTHNIDHPVFHYLINGNYEDFYKDSLLKRKILDYPPYSRMVRMLVRGANQSLVESVTKEICNDLKDNLIKGDKLVGPSPAVVYKVKNRYRYNLLIKVHKIANIQCYYRLVKDRFSKLKKGSIDFIFDVDPYNFM